MRLAEDIIIKPLVTEKSNLEIGDGKYTFIVSTASTKVEVRQAVEKLFQVQVLQVNTMNYRGKKKRMGVHSGYRSKWKKAIVKINTQPSTDGSGKKYKNSIEEYGAIN
jgi:large subunit ribosomal protein L23